MLCAACLVQGAAGYRIQDRCRIQDEPSALEEDVFRVVGRVQRRWARPDVVCLALQEVEAGNLCVLAHLRHVMNQSQEQFSTVWSNFAHRL